MAFRDLASRWYAGEYDPVRLADVAVGAVARLTEGSQARVPGLRWTTTAVTPGTSDRRP